MSAIASRFDNVPDPYLHSASSKASNTGRVVREDENSTGAEICEAGMAVQQLHSLADGPEQTMLLHFEWSTLG